MGTLSKSHQRNRNKYQRRNELKRRDRHGRLKRRVYLNTPEGRAVTGEIFLKSFADFLAGRLDVKPPPPPSDELNERLGRLEDPYPAVALAIF